MAEILALVHKRNAQKTRLLKLLKDVESHQVTPLTSFKLQELLTSTESAYSKAENIQDTILGYMGENDDPSPQVEAMEVIEDLVTTIRPLIKEALVAIPSATGATQGGSSLSSGSGSALRSNVKLPKLELPSFSGKYEEWPSFRDQFEATIVTNASLSGCEKLQYLKSSLKDEALKIVLPFAITNANFDDAWKLCTDRYNNTREIVFSLLSKLFHLQKLSQENANQLRNLVDSFDQCIRQLKNMSRNVEQWDDVLVYMMMEKLDHETKREWVKQLKGTIVPTFNELSLFLEGHIRGLQSLGSSTSNKPKEGKQERKNVHAARSSAVCPVCSEEGHPIYRCKKLLAMTPSDRVEVVRSHKRCFNCLGDNHMSSKCNSKFRCRTCGKAHNTLLHLPKESNVGKVNEPSLNSLPTASVNHNRGYGVLLGTAEVKVLDSTGSYQTCRVLLDPGAEVSFSTDLCSKRLGLKVSKSNVMINGVGGAQLGKAKGQVDLKIKSAFSNFSVCVNALVLPQVTAPLPSFKCGDAWKEWGHLQNLTLADPRYFEPREIDILLGAEVTQRIFTGNRIFSRVDQPIACSSEFGWLVMGPVSSPSVQSYTVQCNVASLDESIQRLWELDAVPNRSPMTEEEIEAEKHFVQNHSRTAEGRYVVSLPFKPNIVNLGPSREIALRRLHHTERRLERHPEHKSEYNKFMADYIQLGHMEEVTPDDLGERTQDGSILSCYLPHHFVLKEDSTTTKLRVVFDGSCKLESGLTLNKCLMVGPTIQPDVFTHLSKFRFYPIAIKSDITKMYRQFLVPDQDSRYQRILWRESPDLPVKEYRLKTITYGTSSAPFCAVRALVQLAQDEGDQFPLAKYAIQNDFYVDDLLSGGSTSTQVVELQRQLTQLLAKGQLGITKWASNSKEVIKQIDQSQVEISPQSLTEGSSTKALGVSWNPGSDSLYFNKFEFNHLHNITKRVVLQDLSKIFDPLGLLAPFVISCKVFFQQLWNLNLGWDEPLPTDMKERWIHLGLSLNELNQISIPRCVIQPNFNQMEIHGFADSSEKAYCAVVYIRTFKDNAPIARILASKTRVAPIKAQSLPRLELCGALLLSKLISSLVSSLDLNCPIYCWTDSEITLRWISCSSRRWVTFVANRVSKIQELIPTESWKFIPGEINPADCGTRGIPLKDLTNNQLWWEGPAFLSQPGLPSFTSSKENTELILKEERKVKILTVTCSFPILARYSSYHKLVRVVGCLLLYKLKLQKKEAPSLWSVEFYDLAKTRVAQLSQQQYFSDEINSLEKNGKVKQTSSLLSLSPYLDTERSLRVGGRLHQSSLPESAKHPLILNGRSPFTKLLVQHFHNKYHHAGNRLLLSLLREQYWITHARDLIKSVCNRCIRCKLLRQRTMSQLMGTLPKPRVTPSPPFHHTGVDYAGPFVLQTIKGRGHKQFKGYFCVFICLATKAVHVEFGTDLSTEGFMGALKRFVSRRGHPFHMYSDCGSNFKGANNELKELIQSTKFNSNVSSFLAESGAKWHFNPPSAPHQGGIWEAAVRSVKYHLLRIIGTTTLTLEEFASILCQPEAALNSRPLSPMSDDDSDFGVITPGHFLIGRPLLSVPQPNLEDIKLNRLSRWQLQEKLFQTFWKTWSLEYLTSLQQRVKWTKTNANPNIGDLVAIKDDDLPPLKWKLGRILKLHPGKDGLTRVITLRTATGELQRPIVKIVPLLPSNEVNFSV